MQEHVVEIDTLGHQGDGLVSVDGNRVVVPFALPGERVRIALDKSAAQSVPTARLIAVEAPAADRQPPACTHFGRCGGCKLQHLAPDAYAAWKQATLENTLFGQGLTGFDVHPLFTVAPHTRRRVTLTAIQNPHKDKTILGFSEAASHTVIDLEECPIVAAEIAAALPDLRALIALLPEPSASGKQARRTKAKKPARPQLTVTATRTGLDIYVKTGQGAITDPLRLQDLSGLTNDRSWARLTIDDDIIAEVRPPQLKFGPAVVTLPPGGFCQATENSERHLIKTVCAHADLSGPVWDLFAGIGTLTFPLAEKTSVHAVESDGPALAALERARDNTQGIKAVTAIRRDLFRNPLTPKELAKASTVVFDPPRAGAKAQAEALAESQVPRIIGVSCNAATFARDARILCDGGYRLAAVFPVDQFLWSPHTELIGVFNRY